MEIMLFYGYIITCGKKAAAIQTKEGPQYYAPLEDISPQVLEDIYTWVSFRVDKTRYEGKTHYGPRYYAYNVNLIIF